MNESWKLVAAGGATGAVFAIFVVFAAAISGFFPAPTDRQLRSYLLSHPSLAIEMVQKAQEEEASDARRRVQAAIDRLGPKTFFDPKVAFVTGPANAKRTVVEFFDYNCGHCRNSYPVIRKFYEAHKQDTRFAFIEFPIFGQASDNAARTAIAARRQANKYVAFHFALMGTDGAIGTSELFAAAQKVGLDLNKLTADVGDAGIGRTMSTAHAIAARVGISGTPFFIINGKAHEGEVTAKELDKLSRS
jgi:protein-disulfide isomerase